MAAGGAGARQAASIARAIDAARRGQITVCYDRRGVCRKACSTSVFVRKATLAQLVERLIRNQ